MTQLIGSRLELLDVRGNEETLEWIDLNGIEHTQRHELLLEEPDDAEDGWGGLKILNFNEATPGRSKLNKESRDSIREHWL